MSEVIQPETRLLVKQLLKHATTDVHTKCDQWIERRSGGKYRSMLAIVEGDASDIEDRRAIIRELVDILEDGALVKLEADPITEYLVNKAAELSQDNTPGFVRDCRPGGDLSGCAK